MATLLVNEVVAGVDRRGMRGLVVAGREYTPLAFQPRVERFVVSALAIGAAGLWFVLLPLEVALGLG